MHTVCSYGKLCAVSRIMIMGLCVLWTELRWLVGPDRTFSPRLRLMKKEHARLSGKLARMATLADPEHESLMRDISLLTEDMVQFESARAEAFQKAHHALRARFARELAD